MTQPFARASSFWGWSLRQPVFYLFLTSHETPASPHSGDATRLFASKTWQRFPFTDAAIDADPALVRTTVTGERREEPVTRAVGPKRPLDEGTSGETRVEPDAKRVYH